MRSKPSEITRGRRGERGAALVMSLLIAMLLLAAGGALIATAGMTVSNAVDSTAEAQAYYAADAGLQAALTVLRRNRKGAGGLEANFHTFACGKAAECDNVGNNLSQWLTYDPAKGRVVLSATPDLSYSLTVTDPSRLPTDKLQEKYYPRYLLVRSIGRGPQGATKVMEMMVDDFAFDFTTRAAVAIHSDDADSVGMTNFTIGNSQPHLWNGNDIDNLAPPLPAFAVTNRKDFDGNDNPPGLGQGPAMGVAEEIIATDGKPGTPPNVIGKEQLGKLSQSELEWWLKDANSARAFLTTMREKAVEEGRYFTSAPKGNMGTDDDPVFTFVDGDADLSGGTDSGTGLMIVTGKYTQAGSSKFHGIVLALGDGNVERSGNPDIAGALVVAKFQHTWDSTAKSYTGSGGFTAPSLVVDGGGNSFVGYSSEWVRKAMESLGSHVIGVVEK